MPLTRYASPLNLLSVWLSLSFSSACFHRLHSLLMSFVLTLYPFSQVPSLALSLHISLLMATCWSIIDILTGLASRPPVAPLFLQPVLLHQSPHETHTHTLMRKFRCMWDKSCDNPECLLRYVCVCVCVQVSETEIERLSESPHTARGRPLYLDPYKRLFPASDCEYTRLKQYISLSAVQSLTTQLCGTVYMCTYLHMYLRTAGVKQAFAVF